MNTETMMEQIRRLNAQAQLEHEERRKIALNRIHELREQQRKKELKDGGKIVFK